jgi:hypothetical protein
MTILPSWQASLIKRENNRTFAALLGSSLTSTLARHRVHTQPQWAEEGHDD